MQNILTRKEISIFYKSLKNLNKTALYKKNEDINLITQLVKKQNLIKKSNLYEIDKIYWLVEDCKKYGTLPSFSKEEIMQVINRHRLIYNEIEDIDKHVAKLISKGKTVGWFQGRGEFGPRSLGNRSLVADPREITSKEKIKKEEKKHF